MEYEWSGKLSPGAEYKVLNKPEDMIVEESGVDNDNGYVTLQSDAMFSVELVVGGVQVAILPAFAV